jgi:molecular chaperone DnaJ
MENLYNILGVAPNASTDEIKKRYRSLAMRYHPDRNSDAGADLRFNAIQKAYEVLTDTKRRIEYDQKLNDRIVLDAEAEAYELWRTVFEFNGVKIQT